MSSKPLGIRETVKVLLSLLTDSGCPHVPSESFRLAKYNKPEAVEIFWGILQHAVYVNHFLQTGDLRDIREITSNYSDCGGMKRVVLYIRKCALDLGYHRTEFYVDAVGSCELLLFFAWLLHQTSFVSHLQTYHVNAALHSMSIPLAQSKQFLLERVESDVAFLGREIQALTSGDHGISLNDALRKIQLMKGMLCGIAGSVENAHKASVKVSQTVLQSCSSSASQSSKNQPLSLHDLFLLRYPEQMAACVKRLEWHVASLHTLIRWQQHEAVFWQWMESVLDQHTTTPPCNELSHEEDNDAATLASTDLCVDVLTIDVAQCQQALSQKITNQKSVMERIHKANRTSMEQAHKKIPTDSTLAHHLALQRVAIEGDAWCPLTSSSGVPGDTQQQDQAVMDEITRLQASLQKTKEHLTTLVPTIAKCISKQ